jgi:hypothetical protein
VLRDTVAVGVALRRLVASTARRWGLPHETREGSSSRRWLSALFWVLNQMLPQPDTANESAAIAAIPLFDSQSVNDFRQTLIDARDTSNYEGVDRGLKCNSWPDSHGSVRRATCGRKWPVI